MTMGSGSLAAMAVFESSFKENMTVSSFLRNLDGMFELT